MPPGRPCEYTPEMADRICAGLAEGLSLRSICKGEDMPHKDTVLGWLRRISEFQIQYVAAKEEGVDVLVEDMLDIADDATNDWMENNDPDNPGYRLNGEHVQRSRLRVDTRKWYASKLKPKKYGERLQTELTGADGGPIKTESMSNEDLARRIAFVLQSAVPAPTPDKPQDEG